MTDHTHPDLEQRIEGELLLRDQWIARAEQRILALEGFTKRDQDAVAAATRDIEASLQEEPALLSTVVPNPAPASICPGIPDDLTNAIDASNEPHMVIEGPEIPKPATRDGFWFGGQKAVDWGDDWNADNASLIVAAVNSLPALLAIAEAAGDVIESRYHPQYDMTEKLDTLECATIDLRTALSSLPNTILGHPTRDEQIRPATGEPAP